MMARGNHNTEYVLSKRSHVSNVSAPTACCFQDCVLKHFTWHFLCYISNIACFMVEIVSQRTMYKVVKSVSPINFDLLPFCLLPISLLLFGLLLFYVSLETTHFHSKPVSRDQSRTVMFSVQVTVARSLSIVCIQLRQNCPLY